MAYIKYTTIKSSEIHLLRQKKENRESVTEKDAFTSNDEKSVKEK
ncbi:hypothetical protein BLGI_838 [Brevibacillus laterosporus GI-9]|nr:hypothetical protein BLGI_838 [Brevibacillus laterosporus GI-9]